MSLVWEHYPTGGGELLTALAYADHAHDDGTSVRPSVAHIARKTRQSERTIQLHLAAMRQTTWLLTVRHAAGGRGRATEYRVNPAWIANPAEFAPFAAAPQRVQSDAQKGEIYGTKGCKAFAPQPSRTVCKPTTVAAVLDRRVVAGVENLDWPPILSGPLRASAEQLLVDCPPSHSQQVLDEVAGLAYRGTVRHPVGLLRALVEQAKRGSFVAAAALEYRHERSEQERRLVRQLQEQADRAQSATPEARSRGRDRLAELRHQLLVADKQS